MSDTVAVRSFDNEKKDLKVRYEAAMGAVKDVQNFIQGTKFMSELFEDFMAFIGFLDVLQISGLSTRGPVGGAITPEMLGAAPSAPVSPEDRKWQYIALGAAAVTATVLAFIGLTDGRLTSDNAVVIFVVSVGMTGFAAFGRDLLKAIQSQLPSGKKDEWNQPKPYHVWLAERVGYVRAQYAAAYGYAEQLPKTPAQFAKNVKLLSDDARRIFRWKFVAMDKEKSFTTIIGEIASIFEVSYSERLEKLGEHVQEVSRPSPPPRQLQRPQRGM